MKYKAKGSVTFTCDIDGNEGDLALPMNSTAEDLEVEYGDYVTVRVERNVEFTVDAESRSDALIEADSAIAGSDFDAFGMPWQYDDAYLEVEAVEEEMDDERAAGIILGMISESDFSEEQQQALMILLGRVGVI